jgi:hypothetical protein
MRSVDKFGGRTVPLNDPPFGWGQSPITEYIESARSNIIATSKNNIYWFQKLERIDSLFRKAIDNLFNSPSILSSFFLLRSHAGYIAAFQMSCAGQISESYAIMRNVIESSLYGYYVYKNEDAPLTWLNRNDDAAAKRKTRSMFSYTNVLSTLRDKDSKLSEILNSLYETTIDLGGHPNPYSILTNLTMENIKETVAFKLYYLNAGGIQQELSMKTLGQVGVTSLYVHKNIWKERFDISGLSDLIEKERPDL